jgi:hypothetical protein
MVVFLYGDGNSCKMTDFGLFETYAGHHDVAGRFEPASLNIRSKNGASISCAD